MIRKATYVLVHGGGHGGWCWSRAKPKLRAKGHEVHTPTLTGLGERVHLLTADVGLGTHITDIVNVLRYEDLANVILVGHSYGGFVITGVADRAPDRVGHLVYLDAAIPVSGESIVDNSPGMKTFADQDMRTVDGIALVLWPDGPVAQKIYGVGASDWAWMKEKLTPHPWRAFTEKLVLQNPQTVQEIPRTIINCSTTVHKLRPAETRARYLAGDRVWEIDAGHDLMITEPDAVADMLLKLANQNP